MKRILSLAVLTALAPMMSSSAGAAEHFVNVGPGNTFSPTTVTIQAGDTVTWSNMGGFHNVVADDDSFRCAIGCRGEGGTGDPSNSSWSVSRVFNDPGTIGYNCEVHVGIGMRGTIIVEMGTPDDPGELGFAQTNVVGGEGDANASFTVNRTGGSSGAVSVSYSTSNGSAQAGSDYSATSGTLNWADNDSDTKTFQVPILDDADEEGNETVNVMLQSPTGGATLGTSAATLTIEDNDEPPANSPGRIQFASPAYDVNEGGGTAQISVTRGSGNDGAVSVDYQTSGGSAQAGSDYSETSGTLNWNDGESGSQSFEVAITNDADDEGDETVNLALSNPGGGATLGSTSSATLTINDNDGGGGGPCVADEQTLCLGVDNRFSVRAVWKDFNDNSGPAETINIGLRDSGLFFFFNEENVEMLVKVLNGCSITNHFWVFFAATTNIEFTLTVVDTQTDQTMVYSNPLGQSANAITDTSAFATCP